VSLGTKPLFLLIGILVLGLTIVGFMKGAIGSALLGTESFLDKPHVSLPATELSSIGPLAITNTLLSSWIATLVLIVLFFLATRKISLVPGRIQNLMELIIESLYDFVASVSGEQYARRFFPIIATIFLFVVANAWLGLLPIYQSLGIISHGHLEVHVLRPAGTDINMTFAIALIAFLFIEYWGFRAHGLGFLKEFVRFGSVFKDFPRNVGMGLVDVFVGFLELLSHFIRIVSFGFRLFGNMLAGEILLLVSAFLVTFVAILPFYGLELLVGGIQALIFAGLTLVFATVAVASADGEDHH
jgi:F-type H+-transporting ATPase subunit a